MNTYYVAGLPYSDELYHHGIKGQKWGVRRYQNADGTWTAAGKIRYGVSKAAEKTANVVKKTGKAVGSVAKKAGSRIAYAYKKRHPSLMTDDELKAYTNRLNLEKNYMQVKADLKSKNGGRIRKIASQALDAISNRLINRAADEIANKIFEKPDKTTDYESVLKNPEKYSDKEINDAFTRSTRLKGLRNNAKDIDESIKSANKKSDTYGTSKDAFTVFENSARGANSFGNHQKAKNWSSKVDWGTPYSEASKAKGVKNAKKWTKKSKVFEADTIYDSYDQYKHFKNGTIVTR